MWEKCGVKCKSNAFLKSLTHLKCAPHSEVFKPAYRELSLRLNVREQDEHIYLYVYIPQQTQTHEESEGFCVQKSLNQTQATACVKFNLPVSRKLTRGG